MLRFKRAELENFFSFESATINFPDNGMVLVLGRNADSSSASSNGSGKSALVSESVVFGLFGRAVRPSVLASDVIRRGQDTCLVKLVFESSGREYVIEREQKVKGIGGLKFWCDGKLIATGKREAQAAINEVVGIDPKLFCQSIVLGQDSMAFATSTDAERKSMLERMIGAEKFDDYRKRAQAGCDSIDAEVAALANVVASAGDLLASEKRRMEDAELARSEFEKNKQRVVADIQALIDSCNTADVELAKLGEQVMGCQARLTPLTAFANSPEAVDAQAEVDAAREAWSSKKAWLASAQRDHAQANAEAQAIKDKCPTCRRDYDAESIAEARGRADAKIAAAASAIDNLQRESAEAMALFVIANERLRGVEAKKNELSAIQRELSALEAKQSVLTRESAKRVYVEARLKEEQSKQFVGADVGPIREKIATLESKIRDAETRRFARMDERSYYEFWVKGWSNKGMKSFMLDSVLSFLNARANEYSNILTDGEIEIVFRTQKELRSGDSTEEFSVVGINRYGACTYACGSSGERERVDLAVALAIQDLARAKVAVGSNLMILDECCVHVDEVGSDRVFALLKKLNEERDRSIMFITHKDELKDVFDECITVTKQGGISRVES